MSGNILTELWTQQDDLFAYPPEQVVLPGSTWTLLAAPEPQRMTLTVIPGTFSDFLAIAPLPYGVQTDAVTLFEAKVTNIHSAVWPLLIGGSWWGYSRVGQTVTVIRTIRRN